VDNDQLIGCEIADMLGFTGVHKNYAQCGISPTNTNQANT